ncbi:MAG TPA: Do family serine endopeptidase [Phenylobacterium sp.]|jgi:Do/DeqQ family serine protease|uniref:Do family serine endopeptidase n=1 Tax=Phenylobacterium sp. TaxID=1871053 RepID=UPI002D23A2FD|nr:Do family serine endopeptidase [Phenylobacterium sp.]HZZ67764.1 Do family serine endopeptidase [Phenylobacterium sp.]
MRAYRVLIPTLALLAAPLASAQAAAQPAAPPALADPTRIVPSSAVGMKQSFAPIVKRAAPAVVNISAKRVVRQQADLFWQIFGRGAPRDRVEGSLGSGVIVRSDGVIVTNNHVIENGQEITVGLSDRREFPAKVLLADEHTDLAILKVDLPPGEKLPVMAIDDRADTQVGDLVLAIGDPFGVGQTVTNGIISATNRTASSDGDSGAYIQTDAAINPGNSGGALVSMDGNLIGVNSFIYSQSGQSSGIGFAIPAVVVRRVVETAMGGGHEVVRPWLGARLQSVTPDIAKAVGLPTPSGALVADVWPGGAAVRGGLKQGDVVTSIDGQPVVDAATLNYAIGTHRPGEVLHIGVRRDKAEQTLSVHAEAAPATPARDEKVIAGRNPFQGATVVNLSPAVAEEVGLDPFGKPGVIVTKTAAGVAQQVGVQPGDIIRAVNGRDIKSVADLTSAVVAATPVWQVTIERNGHQFTGTFRT